MLGTVGLYNYDQSRFAHENAFAPTVHFAWSYLDRRCSKSNNRNKRDSLEEVHGEIEGRHNVQFFKR